MQDNEKKAIEFLEYSVKNFKIFIDSCALFSEQAELFWQHIEPILKREGKAIIVPYDVYKEVEKYTDPERCKKAGKAPNFNEQAKKALRTIVRLQNSGQIEVYTSKEKKKKDKKAFADRVFLSVILYYHMDYDIILITHDRKLARDIIGFGGLESLHSDHLLYVQEINEYGYLSRYDGGKRNAPTDQRPDTSRCAEKGKGIPPDECFAIATSVREVSGQIPVSSIPVAEDEVIAERKDEQESLKLIEEIASGGEGIIYTTSKQGYVAKIYKKENLDCAKYEKLCLMMTKKIECKGVCFPCAILYNQQHEFVGCLMEQAKGRSLRSSVFLPPRLKTLFPDWTRRETATLCVTILQKLQYLHERNIILGDINPDNILMVSPTEVYFVDTDSYQVEDFLCPVGTINFTAPEIQRKPFSSFLRSMGNEYFAVATLLFMIMMPGKPPYSLLGGENQVENILAGDFAYPSGERSNGKAPAGMWRFCWSHLPRFLKDDFYETFHINGKHHAEKTRFTTAEWLDKFGLYLKLLYNGSITEYDPMSLDIFPKRFKRNPNANYITCRLCGEQVDENWTEQGICSECLKEGEIYYCGNCGQQMIYTNRQKYVKQTPRYSICKDCYEKKKQTHTTRCCVVCNRLFDITNGEIDYYTQNGYQLPKRCPDCRANGFYANSAPLFPYDQPVPQQFIKKRPWWLWAILILIGIIVFWLRISLR